MTADKQNSWAGSPSPEARPFRYLDSVYFQDGQWLTGLLASTLYLVLAAALDAAGHVESLAIVIPVTLAAFALGVFMSFSRFDGFFALSHSMFVGLAWILFLMASTVPASAIDPFLNNGVSELQARVYFVLLRLLDWVDAAINRSASADNYVFVFEIFFLMWWLAYLGAWSIFRHGYTWRAVVPAGVVLLINTYYAPQSTLGFLVAFVLVGLVLLIRTNLAEQQLRWRIQRVYFSPDIAWDFLRNGLVYSVVIVVLAWILPGLGRNPQLREFLAPVNNAWQNTSENVQRLYQGLNRQAAERGASFGDSLTLGGERNVTDSPVFQVVTNQGRYWRAVAFDTYDGRSWQSTGATQAEYPAGEIVPVASWRARQAISQTVEALAPIGDVLFGAPEVAQADIRLKAQVWPQAGALAIPAAAAGPGAQPVEFTMVRASRELDHGDRYTFVSAVTDAAVADLERAGTDYPAAIVDRFLQLPPDFSPQVAALAQSLTAGAATPYAKAKAIEAYLRTIPYNDAIPAPPAGVDPLEYFLFELQQGYCDYYATAMAMMLRIVGVPARAVSGYAEGIYDPEAGLYFVTERDAHTWVEVFFPEYGWIEFEPTAGESPLDRPQSHDSPETSLTSQQEEPEQPESPLAQPTPGADESEPPPFTGEELLGDDLGGAGDSGMPWWVWALAILLALPLGVLLIWRVRHSGPTGFATAVPVLVYERLQGWTRRLGLGPTANQTPFEHADQVGQALPQAQPQVAAITDTYVRYRFAGQPAAGEDATTDATLNRTWRQLEPIFWRAWLQRWRDRLFHRSRQRKVAKDFYRLE